MLGGAAAHADVIFTENFNSYTTTNSTFTQYATGLNVYYGGSFSDLSGTGSGANLAVDRTGTGDFAAMLYGGATGGAHDSSDYNTLSLITPIAANTAGVTYTVTFDAAPAVFNQGYQATDVGTGKSGDYIVFQFMDAASTNFANYSFVTPVFTATAANPSNPFTTYSFTYVGDGVGSASFNIFGVTAANEFAGAIDNLVISSPATSSTAVPEPASMALLGLGLAGAGFIRRRQTAA